MKKTIMSLVLLLIAICVFAQAPQWQWATKAGGTNGDYGRAITIDDAGNSYVTGVFRSTATFGSYTLTSSGSSEWRTDIFVAKMDAVGNWQWATKAGGTGYDYGKAITIDDAGNSYVTGTFKDTANFGSYSLTSSGGIDIFVAKMDADGNWQWATKAGGTSEERGNSITIDDAGNCYVTGYFQGTATFGSYALTSSGESDIFVAKMDTDGNWQWATQAGNGTTWGDRGSGITIDDAGNCYVTGFFIDTTNFGSYSLTSSGELDIFVAKMDADGNWQWATKAGGTNADGGLGITIDDAGNCYVTGIFEDTATFGSYSLTSSGFSDIFVAKMDAVGNWQWATKAGGTDDNRGNAITIDNTGNSYVTGHFLGTATFGSYSLTSSGLSDIFVAKMDANGNWLWATKAGGYNWARGNGITIDDTGNIYVTGRFEDTATFGSYALTSSGEEDIFVAKMDTTFILVLNPPQNLFVTEEGYATWDAPSSKGLLGYNVYLDGSFIEYTTDLFYQYTDLTNGQSYLSGVSAVYDEGESNVIEFQFTYIIPVLNPPQNLFVTDEGYATWEEPIGGPQMIQVDPLSVSYWTGSCTYTAWTDDSKVRGHDVDDGWMMFDISEIPAGATITEIEFHGFINDNSWPYWEINGVYLDPLTASVGDFNADIQDDQYNFFPEPGDLPIDWRVEILGGDANADMETALAQGWFCIGINSIDNSNTYYIEFDGWDEANPPYLVVTYEDAKQKTVKNTTSNMENSELLGYNIYIDGNFIEYTTDLFYQFEDLINEQTYQAGVSAVYDEGESAIVEFEFTYLYVGVENNITPVTELLGNYPNPFNSSTTISFSVEDPDKNTMITIYNFNGQKIKTLVEKKLNSGTHQAVWDGKNDSGNAVSSGIYFYKMKHGDKYIGFKKMILLR